MRAWCLGFLGAGLFMVFLSLQYWALTEGLDLHLFESLHGHDETADLVVAPGTRGFLPTLRTGPQIHVYDEAMGRTRILDEIWLGTRSFRFPVADYDGFPSRDVTPERISRLEIPHAFLFVRRGGEYGEGVVVKPGRCVVEGAHEVTLAPGEIAWVTVGPTGMTIDERDAP